MTRALATLIALKQIIHRLAKISTTERLGRGKTVCFDSLGVAMGLTVLWIYQCVRMCALPAINYQISDWFSWWPCKYRWREKNGTYFRLNSHLEGPKMMTDVNKIPESFCSRVKNKYMCRYMLRSQSIMRSVKFSYMEGLPSKKPIR